MCASHTQNSSEERERRRRWRAPTRSGFPFVPRPCSILHFVRASLSNRYTSCLFSTLLCLVAFHSPQPRSRASERELSGKDPVGSNGTRTQRGRACRDRLHCCTALHRTAIAIDHNHGRSTTPTVSLCALLCHAAIAAAAAVAVAVALGRGLGESPRARGGEGSQGDETGSAIRCGSSGRAAGGGGGGGGGATRSSRCSGRRSVSR